MAFKNRLLATAAIPLIALMGMSQVSAAELIRPVAPVEAQSLVIKVQATDDELLQQQKKERQKQRQERREKKQNDASGQDNNQNNGGNKRNKQNADAQQQDNSQEVQQPRRKKQNDDAQMQNQQTDQEQVQPRRKKNADAQQQDNANQAQQTDQEQVQPRRKKNADAQQQDNANQAQQDDQQQVKPRKKKNADAETQQDNANQAQQTDQEQVKPRRKQQNDNAASDQNQSTDDALKNAVEKNNKKKHKQDQNQDQAQQPVDNNNGSIEKIETGKQNQQQADDGGNVRKRDRKKLDNPAEVKKAQDIAADPKKTTDTVVLPVENGAAVLDSDKDADNRGADRNRRKQQREENKQVQAPKSDKDAQRGFREDKQVRIRPVLEDRGERIPGFKGYDDVGGRRLGDRDNRVIINVGGNVVIRSDDDTRISRRTPIRYERLPNNQIREVVIRPDGTKVVTVRNRYGEIVRRSRIDRGDREVVIFYSPVLERGRDRLYLRDPGLELPPMRLNIPVRDYIIDVSGNNGNRNYEEFLDEPPVEAVERVYSVDEVKNSARIRDKMRRIDLDTITFETGSADIDQDQVQSLKQVGAAIKQILDKDPGETFMIEGHTDAVGSDESNLVLSDSRAESVANVLSDAFNIPAENLVTQGYGERFLKIDSDGPVRENRRVTIRRITPLVRPLASAE